MQNLALAGEEIVLDVEPLHGLEMAMEDGGGDEVGDLGGLVASGFEGVKRVEAKLLACGSCAGSAVYHWETRA